MMRLTPRQKAILTRCCKRNIFADGPETGGEMAEALWGSGLFQSLEQGQRTSRQLVRKGLLVELGYSQTNARCYGPSGDGVRLILEGTKEASE